METYITTITFTELGIRNIKDTRQRAAALRKVAKKMGVKVRSIYWTLGDYDGLLVFEAPNAATATALMVNIGSKGHVRTSTVQAFNATEMDAILAGLNE